MEGAFPAKSFMLQLMMFGWRLTTREEQNLPSLGSYSYKDYCIYLLPQDQTV